MKSTDEETPPQSASGRARARFLFSWITALALIGVALPHAVDVSWRGVIPVLVSVHWPALLALLGLWFLGLYVHSFVLTAAAPSLSHRRALTLNMTGSAVSNVLPLGGAAGVELNRRMMRAWGIDARGFSRYTIVTNLWDVAAKLVLPVLAVLALSHAGEAITMTLKVAALVAGAVLLGLAAFAFVLLRSAHATSSLGQQLEQTAHAILRLARRDRPLGLAEALLDLRRECRNLVAVGWPRMSAGIAGYVLLQYLLLALCLHLTSAQVTWPQVLAGFAAERILTIVPITPGGIGIADLGLVGVLVTLGGNPAGVAAAAVLYRVFVLALEVPVGGGVLGLWVLVQRNAYRAPPLHTRLPGPARIAHVTDAFLPCLGGIETHVDDLARHQRASGLSADVLTPIGGSYDDPPWVRRLPSARARRAVTAYDVVHVHLSLWSPYGLAMIRAATARGIPTLITLHSMWTGIAGVLRLVALGAARGRPVLWSAVSSAAAESFGPGVVVLPNAIDVDYWRPDGTAPVPIITLVSVMRLMPRKRPLQLLRMYEQVRRLSQQDTQLVIVGDGPLRRRLERYMRRHGLTRHVRITGRVPRHQVRAELRAGSLYVVPTPMESFGIAALEARAAGLPIVAPRCSGVREFVQDRVDGRLVANDNEMIEALAELVTDDALRDRISTHNRRVAPEFDWSLAVTRTTAHYRQAAERTNRPLPELTALLSLDPWKVPG